MSPWIWSVQDAVQLYARVFCFPYAGASAHIFHRWGVYAPADLDLWGVELPGHGQRLREAPFKRLDRLAAALANHLHPYLKNRYVFFGHSMGALVAFELARELCRRKQPGPAWLFLSGCQAPHLPSRKRVLHSLGDVELISELRSIRGTPVEVLNNSELMKVLMPSFRADFELCETYSCNPESPLDTPIQIFGGACDPDVTADELAAWSLHTRQFAGVKSFAGDHFYLNRNAPEILHTIYQKLQQSERPIVWRETKSF